MEKGVANGFFRNRPVLEVAMTKRDLRVIRLATTELTWIRSNHTWVLPQLVSLWAELPLVKVGECISPTQTLLRWKEIFLSDPDQWKALWNLSHQDRKQILSVSQVKDTRWSVGVPIIMSAFLEHRGVTYSSWDFSDHNIQKFLGTQIWESYQGPRLSYSVNEVLQFREQGLRVRTGAKAGQSRQLTHYLPWGGVTDESFKALPLLSKYMVTQTWIYHPSIRHKFMICDWNNMDVLPPPLVHQDVLDSKQLQTKVKVSTDFDEIFNL